MPFSDATRSEAERLVARYAVARSALLPMLHLVQSVEGYVSEDGVALCAELLGLTKAEVGSVASFYTMYKREPFGDYLLSVCTNPTCQIAGGQKIYDAYVEACGGHVDTEGAGVMVEHAECLGICDAAPVVTINYENYGPVTSEEAMELLTRAKAGDPPESPLSKHTPGTFTAVEREFSGIEDGTDAQLIEAAQLQATMTAGPSHRTGETSIPILHPGADPRGHGGAAFRAASGIADPAPLPETPTEPSEKSETPAESSESSETPTEPSESSETPVEPSDTPAEPSETPVAADEQPEESAVDRDDATGQDTEEDPQ